MSSNHDERLQRLERYKDLNIDEKLVKLLRALEGAGIIEWEWNKDHPAGKGWVNTEIPPYEYTDETIYIRKAQPA